MTLKFWVSVLVSVSLLGVSSSAMADTAKKTTTKTTADDNYGYNPPSADDDPLEGFNRAMFKFNYGFDTAVLRPITYGYRTVVPEKGRTSVNNFLTNLYTPVTFANSVFQRDPQNSFATLWRFIMNTTFGIGGLFDPASSIGLKNRPADFGETLAFYGVEPGPYLVLPVMGPSNFRDGVGRLTDSFLNPINYAPSVYWISDWSAEAVNARSNNWTLLDDIYNNSLDPYTTFRSGYTQKRVSDIRRAKASRDAAIEQSRAQ